MSRGADFIKALHPASFRGVPFAVTSSRKTFGRRIALHEYPFRDVIWAEDLGRKGREIGLVGFLIAESAIYGGGAILDQQDRLIAALETKGPGKLVHPTLGELNVTCTASAISESDQAGGVLEIDLTFLEAGEAQFPAITTATPAEVISSANLARASVVSDLTKVASIQLSSGSINALTALSAVQRWSAQIRNFARDATKIFRLASQLTGDFGRFFNGHNISGIASGFGLLLGPGATITQIAQAAAGAQASVNLAIANMETVAANLGLGASSNSPADLAGAAAAAIAALQATAADPADAVRLLSGLATGLVSTPGALVLQRNIDDCMRRSAVVALAQAGTTYQPSSYDDANAVRAIITGALDAEVEVAGDQGDDATFTSLRALRAAVVRDLRERGASVAPFVSVTVPAPLPAVVLAHRLYRDASRADELVSEAHPVSPLFMPTAFQALAA